MRSYTVIWIPIFMQMQFDDFLLQNKKYLTSNWFVKIGIEIFILCDRSQTHDATAATAAVVVGCVPLVQEAVAPRLAAAVAIVAVAIKRGFFKIFASMKQAVSNLIYCEFLED